MGFLKAHEYCLYCVTVKVLSLIKVNESNRIMIPLSVSYNVTFLNLISCMYHVSYGFLPHSSKETLNVMISILQLATSVT